MKTKLLSFIALSLMVIVALSSCNPRKAHVIGKVLHEIDQLADNEYEESDGDYQGGDYGMDDNNAEAEQIYSVVGIKYFGNSETWYDINSKYAKAVNTQDGFYLVLYDIEKYSINKNDISTISTLPTLLDVPVDGSGVPDRIMLDVSKYKYRSRGDNCTYFFNIY